MKKALQLFCVFLLCIAFSGCGEKTEIPDLTGIWPAESLKFADKEYTSANLGAFRKQGKTIGLEMTGTEGIFHFIDEDFPIQFDFKKMTATIDNGAPQSFTYENDRLVITKEETGRVFTFVKEKEGEEEELFDVFQFEDLTIFVPETLYLHDFTKEDPNADLVLIGSDPNRYAMVLVDRISKEDAETLLKGKEMQTAGDRQYFRYSGDNITSGTEISSLCSVFNKDGKYWTVRLGFRSDASEDMMPIMLGILEKIEITE